MDCIKYQVSSTSLGLSCFQILVNLCLSLIFLYRKIIGRLVYLSINRLCISYSATSQSVCSSSQDSSFSGCFTCSQIFEDRFYYQFVLSCSVQVFSYRFSDANWGSSLFCRKSVTDFHIFLRHSLISWKTKKQVTISRSSTESEQRSMAATTYELVWLSFLLQDLKVTVPLPCTLFCDNKVARQIAPTLVFMNTLDTRRLIVISLKTRFKMAFFKLYIFLHHYSLPICSLKGSLLLNILSLFPSQAFRRLQLERGDVEILFLISSQHNSSVCMYGR